MVATHRGCSSVISVTLTVPELSPTTRKEPPELIAIMETKSKSCADTMHPVRSCVRFYQQPYFRSQSHSRDVLGLLDSNKGVLFDSCDSRLTTMSGL